MPSTPAPTRAQRSLRSLIVQTIKRMRSLPGARGVDRVAPPEFRHEKILPRLDSHDRFPSDGKARTYPLSTVDGRRPGAQLYELRSLRIEGNVYACMRGLVQALRFMT
jgi:hypothetical protein